MNNKSKSISYTSCQGKTLSKIYLCSDGWKPLTTQTKMPDNSKLFNFEVAASKNRKFLVLDNYGDESLSDDTMHNIIGLKLFKWNLVIDVEDGTLYIGAWFKEADPAAPPIEELADKHIYSLAISEMTFGRGEPLRLPEAFLPRLNELKSKKRPYFITAEENSVWRFIDRLEGFNSLKENIVVDLDFDNERIQIWNDAYRKITNWKSK